MNEIKICDKNKCTGCCACMNICPVNAIEMVCNNLGKTIPKIDNDKCIQCKLCIKRCPVNNKSKFNEIKECYAISVLNNIDSLMCSSGGAATCFGKSIIEHGGYVFGTLFNENMDLVFHCVSTKKQLDDVKGSKYVQAEVRYTYKEVKEKLRTNRLVLFIGTPCQIDGLYFYLGEDPDNLITVDLICHGTPPQKYLLEYISDDLNNIDNVTFRYKGSWDFITWKNNKIRLKHKSDLDYYYQAFLKGLSYRDNCYSCRYAKVDRVSDITIGDFWGLKRETLQNNFPQKVSVVLLNSTKGQKLFEMSKSLFIYEKRQKEEAIEGNDQLNCSQVAHKDRGKFEDIYKKKGFLEAVKATDIPNKIKKTKIRKFFSFPIKIVWFYIKGK